MAEPTPQEILSLPLEANDSGRSQTMTDDRLTLDELLQAVELVDAYIDASTGPDYQAQPLARDWARVTKVCEEAGEVWRALSKMTGENPRKGVCGTLDDLLGELGDTALAAICAIQHLTKDTDATWQVVSAAMVKSRSRVAEKAPSALPGEGDPPGHRLIAGAIGYLGREDG